MQRTSKSPALKILGAQSLFLCLTAVTIQHTMADFPLDIAVVGKFYN